MGRSTGEEWAGEDCWGTYLEHVALEHAERGDHLVNLQVAVTCAAAEQHERAEEDEGVRPQRGKRERERGSERARERERERERAREREGERVGEVVVVVVVAVAAAAAAHRWSRPRRRSP